MVIKIAAMFRHVLKKVKVYPLAPQWNRKVYMPISMNNRLIRTPETLEEILAWVFERTDSIQFIIGDYLHRYNILLSGTSEMDAICIAEKIGNELQEIIQKGLQKFPDKDISFRSVQEFYQRDDFRVRLAYFEELYKRNTVFKKGIDRMIENFLNRQGHIEATEIQIKHCLAYLLEELVIFEFLAEEDYLINIYPGKQLDTFKDIVLGKLKGISPILEKVSLVEMKFKFSATNKT
ncbi:tRNA-dependent cyclodipeptide synthase [Flavobacterium sp.]|uniref:tRNA-dependent cyclodipeptide synthase n=1 Tax=Flavobacterium sp. TaxID=239 RepID=UPI0040347A07